jgi:filamentous hemagglutinin family protein
MRPRLPILLLSTGVTIFSGPSQGQELPVPCLSCAGGPSSFVTSGVATYVVSGATGTVNQQSDRAILNWQSFDIGAGNTVEFRQPSATSAALNRIFQSDPSRIFGALKANGEVYLINQNGILFGQGAQVDVGSLTASTLDVSDEVFTKIGLTGAINQPQALAAFSGDSAGAIRVEQGATIRTVEGGRVLLIGSAVENAGRIATPGGQTLLVGANDKVYVAADSEVRGLLVEVDTGGSVTNFGEILSERGNTTLIGLAVNQQGRINATTSVNLGGSIYLRAREGASNPDQWPIENGQRTPLSTRTGTVVVGEGSVMEILPEDSTDALTDQVSQPLSRIDVMGKTIKVESGSRITVRGGTVAITATTTPQIPLSGSDRTAQIHVEEGAVIDVSGDESTIVPMERNQSPAVRLLGDVTADSPVVRQGPLARQEIYFDLRKGTPLANVASFQEGIKRTAAERLSKGGEVRLSAEGDVVVNAGSSIDFSGGAVEYLPGYLTTTKLVSQGRIVDISEADPLLPYDGFFGDIVVNHSKWGVRETFRSASGTATEFHPGYIERKDAGSLLIDARGGVVLAGQLQGTAERGNLQRNAPSEIAADAVRPFDEAPLGGRLSIATGSAAVISSQLAVQSVSFGELIDTSMPLAVDPEDLKNSGISRLEISANGYVELPSSETLSLDAGGEVTLRAERVLVDGTIRSAQGSVVLASIATQAGSIELGHTALIDVSGQWINDSALLNPLGVLATGYSSGGSVAISSVDNLMLAAGSRIDVSGGARLASDGTFHAGKAGSISLASKPSSDQRTSLVLDGELVGFGMEQGGQLKIDANGFRIANGAEVSTDADGNTVLSPEFFVSNGFSDFSFVARFGGFEVDEGTHLSLRPLNLRLLDGVTAQPTGTEMDSITERAMLPDYLRGSSSLSVSLERADTVKAAEARVRIAEGAWVETEIGGSVLLRSDSDLVIDGVLSAPAGSISLVLGQPRSANETGFRADQAIHLGATSRLLAQGAAVLEPAPLGIRQGQVFDGGSIALNAERGYIVAAQGSEMDVSGTAQTLDLPLGDFDQLEPLSVASDAGRISLTAAEGVLLSGSLLGRPGGESAAGGRLSIKLDSSKRDSTGDILNNSNLTQFLPSPARIAVGEGAPIAIAPGTDVPAWLNGLAQIDPTTVRDGQFSVLELIARPVFIGPTAIAPGSISLLGDVDLSVGRSLMLDAAVISSNGGAASLTAPYIAIGATDAVSRLPAAVAAGHGSLTIGAQHIDLLGPVSLTGFAPESNGSPSISLNSNGDIRAIGVRQNSESSSASPGSLSSAVSLTLRAAQVYPATLTDYRIEVSQPGGRIVVEQGEGAAAEALSAGGRLTLAASEVVQGGSLLAPFGEIRLEGSDRVRLLPGSVTSTSGFGLTVPFGQTEFGEEWVYPLTGLNRIFDGAPEKSIVLSSADVRVDAGATLDLRGGGELTAYEFTPGPGGSRDILNSTNEAGSFAVIPGYSNPFGVYDPLESPASGIEPGLVVHLAGGSDLPAGAYVVLPARYALLPGAYLITPTHETDVTPGAELHGPDGITPLVAGQFGYSGTSTRDTRWSGFIVENGAQMRERVDYIESKASTFFDESASNLVMDAGGLTIDAERSVALQGSLLSTAAQGGRGTQVDLVAMNIAVVDVLTGSGTRVEFLDSELEALHAESILLGGTRGTAGDETQLDVSSSSVQVESGATLGAAEIILAARDSITVAPGATLAATGTALTRATSILSMEGDSTIARVSTGPQVSIERTNVTGLAGRLSVDAGSALSAPGSITLDATADLISAGDLVIGGGSLSFGASRVSLGEVPQGVGGLVLSSSDLGRLQGAELLLNSRSTVDVYGGVSAEFDALRLDTTVIRGFNNDGVSAQLAADRIVLSNMRGASAPDDAANGTGSLLLSAREIALDGGTVSIEGFDAVRVAGAERITGNRNSRLFVDGDLQLDTGLLTAGTGADVGIVAAGDLVTTRNGAADAGAATDGLGARMVLSGRNVTHGSALELHSGRVTLSATGAGGSVTLAADSLIDVSGTDRQFSDVLLSSPGGTVDLVAPSGGVILGDRSRVDVSGSSLAADAGAISILSGGDALRIGDDVRLLGEAAAGFRSSSVALDVVALDGGFSALNALLESGGFHHSRSLRQRSGDIRVAASDVVQAAEIALVADSGAIEIAGRLSAAAAQGGRVRLMAQNDVILHGSARIDARATAHGGAGGLVELGTRQGLITIDGTNVAGQSTIDVAGIDDAGGAFAGGEVRLRAPRVGADGIGIDTLTGLISGAEAVKLEAFRAYDGISILDEGTLAGIAADTQQYMANVGVIESALGIADDPLYHVIPGEEISSPGDMTIGGRINLQERRYDGEAGVLTLRAGGNLNIDAPISDGFAVQSVGGQSARDVVQTGQSWSYRLIGGAQDDSADPLSVVAGAGGVKLAENTFVRTGTGDIEIASGGDVTLTSASSVVYTVGENRGHGALDPTDAEILLRGDFVHNGGDVRVSALGSLNGIIDSALPDWLPRFGGSLPSAPIPSLRQDFPAMWAIAAEKFHQGFGALGGGDVVLRAAGDANGVSAAIASTGLPLTIGGSTPDVAGGGSLLLQVDGDIKGGVFTVMDGSAELSAGQAVRGFESALTPEPIAPILQIGDADFSLMARAGVEIETAFNPTVALQDPRQGVTGRGLGSKDAYFFTYTDASSIAITSIAGDIALNARESNLNALHGGRAGYATTKDALLVYPGSLTAAALAGSIVAQGDIRLFPTPLGTLDLFAGFDITTDSAAAIALSDGDRTLLPTLTAPAPSIDALLQVLAGHGPTPLHAGDDRPARLVAHSGIVGPRGNGQFNVELAKGAHIFAGGDVRNLNLSVQHDDVNDYTVVEATRDIVFPTFRDGEGRVALNGNRIDVNGPGMLHLLAGRDVDLGASTGIESRGNLVNPALPPTGAGISIMTGLSAGIDYDAFHKKYLEDTQEYADELAAFLQRFPSSGGGSDLERFAALEQAYQREFTLSVLFSELRESGIAASSGDKSQFDRGFEAIETLFPEDSYTGDLRSFLSRVTTLDGGDVNIVVPGGLVNAGVASSTALAKEADELGIVVQRSGTVNALADGDFLVNQSRVFALDGGDILIWSSKGDIDAGRGAKSALAVPPPVVNFDANGNVTVEFPPAIAGSGIRATVTSIGRSPGDVYLFAPVGVVDAGDAGIGSAGNITIAATEVIGADNIDVGGVAVGIPIDAGGLGASLAGVSSVASSASTAAEAAVESGSGRAEEEAPLSDAALSWLDVFVVGFGEEVCKPDDIECIKRNQKDQNGPDD